MKLAIVVTHPIQYYTPVFKLLAQQVEVRVFYTDQSKQQYDKDFNRRISWDIPLFNGYPYEWIHGNNSITRITNFSPDFLLVYSWSAKGHLKLLRHFHGKIKILFRGDSTLLKEIPIWKSLMKTLLLSWVYTHVDHAFYTGTHNKSYFIKYGLKDIQLSFSPHAIDNRRFAKPQSPQDIKERLAIPKEHKLILYTGKFTLNKNVCLLLKAFLEINDKCAHLLFVGSGVLEQHLLKVADRHAHVHVATFQNQSIIPAYYQACDLFCMPSKSESWGLSINEAMACGKAVLVSDQCGAAIDLVNENTGRIFKSNNLADLKVKLQELLNNHSLRKNAGLHAKNKIRDWSFEIQVHHILKFLQA